MWQDVHIQISISFLELSVGPTVYSLKPRLWGPNLELWGWEWALATTAWLDGEVPLNYFWFQWEGWFWCETGLFYSILHPPARIILKIHKSGDTIPFLRTLRWLPTSLSENPLYKPVATVVCVLWSSFMSLTSFLTPVSLAHSVPVTLAFMNTQCLCSCYFFYLWSSFSEILISFKSLLKCCFLSLPLIMVFKIASPLPTLPGTLILVPCFFAFIASL